MRSNKLTEPLNQENKESDSVLQFQGDFMGKHDSVLSSFITSGDYIKNPLLQATEGMRQASDQNVQRNQQDRDGKSLVHVLLLVKLCLRLGYCQ